MNYSTMKLDTAKETMIIGSSQVYATTAALPTSNVAEGTRAFVQNTDRPYIWIGSGWYLIKDYVD